MVNVFPKRATMIVTPGELDVTTAVSALAMLCAIAFLWEVRRRIIRDEVDEHQPEASRATAGTVSWNRLLLLVGPFAAAYFALLIPRSSVQLIDRYLLSLMFLSGLGLIRAFQNFVQPYLPAVTKVLVGLVAIYSIGAKWMFQALFPIHGVRDYTCGYRAYRADAIREASKKYGDHLITETGFSCMADLLLKLRKLPLEMSEIPLELRYDRRGGASKMRVIRTIRQTLFLMLRRRFGQL